MNCLSFTRKNHKNAHNKITFIYIDRNNSFAIQRNGGNSAHIIRTFHRYEWYVLELESCYDICK